MIEIHPNLFVGAQSDEEGVRGKAGWFFVHACKEPYHRIALGYSGRAASKDHPEYLMARRKGRIILNLVDVDNVNYIGTEIIDAALDAIHANIGVAKVLVHCNLGQSRSPTIAFLYLTKHTDRFAGLGMGQAIAAFKQAYPTYNPARGIADYVRLNWDRYQREGLRGFNLAPECDVKFLIGDATDAALCVVLQHEFLRCDDAFADFEQAATNMIFQGENRRIAYRTYNAYARFLHHLYEFVLSAVARERHDTTQLGHEMKDKYIASHTQRILSNRRHAVLNGTAPSWENDISAFPEKIPPTFAAEFRQVRNVVYGHALAARATLNLSDFYSRNHMYVYMLYQDIKKWWGNAGSDFPDLNEITNFSILVRGKSSPQT